MEPANCGLFPWMDPGKPPMESTGTSEDKMVLGGRFLRQEYTGDMMGTVFTGIGFTGYDNHTKKFESTWMDSMGTAILLFEGTADADGKSITQESHYDDPFKGPMKWRSVTRIVDERTHLFEMYSIDRNGKEEKMMEVTYHQRQGSSALHCRPPFCAVRISILRTWITLNLQSIQKKPYLQEM